MQFAHDLIDHAQRVAANQPEGLTDREHRWSYAEFAWQVDAWAAQLQSKGLRAGDRVAITMQKSVVAVAAFWGVLKIGCVAVPINPALKAAQLHHVLSDCDARWFFTSERHQSEMQGRPLRSCQAERLMRAVFPSNREGTPARIEMRWMAKATDHAPAIIFYTSGSTGKPKGVVFSHANVLAGARSVAAYLKLCSEDRILAALPLSFDAGFSQLSTGLMSGATVVLHDYVLAQDCLRTIASEAISVLTAVPPLWSQLAGLEWGEQGKSLRLMANTGGHMPGPVLRQLRVKAPLAQVVLMFGLTEAFRSTFLDPSKVDRKPDSIGQAIPGASVLVVRPDGSECDVDEVGELVHRGPTVALGYWNNPAATAERYKLWPAPVDGLRPEWVVWSGDFVRRDAEGDLYFVERRDAQIKTSGYRVSPKEIEEQAYDSGLVQEAVAFGVPDPQIGQAVMLTVWGTSPVDEQALRHHLMAGLPRYMVPAKILVQDQPLPRSANGKFDRQAIAKHFEALHG
jgi:acyl-CoA ligase (AMP-forming) (exosortase A-associated)